MIPDQPLFMAFIGNYVPLTPSSLGMGIHGHIDKNVKKHWHTNKTKVYLSQLSFFTVFIIIICSLYNQHYRHAIKTMKQGGEKMKYADRLVFCLDIIRASKLQHQLSSTMTRIKDRRLLCINLQNKMTCIKHTASQTCLLMLFQRFCLQLLLYKGRTQVCCLSQKCTTHLSCIMVRCCTRKCPFYVYHLCDSNTTGINCT